MFAFGEAQSRDEAIVPRNTKEAAEGAGNGNGDQNGANGDGDNMESNSSIDLQGVEGVQLSIESQLVHLQEKLQENLPMASRPPI